MAWDLILWILALASNIGLLALLIYQIICLSDLEADYMNPYESAANINSVVLIEFILQGAFCALFLLTGHWFMFSLTVPVACYHVRLFGTAAYIACLGVIFFLFPINMTLDEDAFFWFLRREHLVDVTEIFRALGAEKKIRLIKLAVYLCFFFLVIVRIPTSIYSTLSIFSSKHGELDFRSSIHEF